jgi:hypothetical protein
MSKLSTLLLFSSLATGIAMLPAQAESVVFVATLSGASEVPPNSAAGTGTVEATLDTDAKTLGWTITYSGLSGDATAAHFHGPAAEGANAGPVLPIEGSLASPISGTATLSDAQIADLQNGLWYFNIHTAQFPDGELRGQLKK